MRAGWPKTILSMSAVIFLCPRTGFKVQGWIADEPTADAGSVPVDCPMCQGIHLVNPASGQGQNDRSDQRGSPPLQTDDKARGLANNATAQIGLVTVAVIALLAMAWRYIW